MQTNSDLNMNTLLADPGKMDDIYNVKNNELNKKLLLMAFHVLHLSQ